MAMVMCINGSSWTLVVLTVTIIFDELTHHPGSGTSVEHVGNRQAEATPQTQNKFFSPPQETHVQPTTDINLIICKNYAMRTPREGHTSDGHDQPLTM